MAGKLEIPMETKFKFALGGYQGVFKGFMHALQERDGGEATLKLYEKVCKEGDRVKNLTNTIMKNFNIEGNDLDAIKKWHEIWWELAGVEGATSVERTETFERIKITGCPWDTQSKDISDWYLIFGDIVVGTINPKASFERVMGKCAGDPHCEYVFRLEQ